MCHKLRNRFYAAQRRQQGFLMPLALFILVGMAALALAMSRISSNTFVGVTQESISVQAFYAADSGAAYAMHRLLFNAASSVDVDGRCNALNGGTLNLNAPGLQNCSAALTCAKAGSLNGDEVYTLRSAARCGSGTLTAERVVEVGAGWSPD